MIRYAIDDQSMDWAEAESQVSRVAKYGVKPGKSTVVSVKTSVAGQKRKGGEDRAEAQEKEKKPTRRGKKLKR